MESGWLDFKTGNKVKTSSEYVAEIQTLRAKVASADVLVEALRKVDKHLDAMKCNEDNIEVGLALGLVIDKAIAAYDKLSEVKHDNV